MTATGGPVSWPIDFATAGWTCFMCKQRFGVVSEARECLCPHCQAVLRFAECPDCHRHYPVPKDWAAWKCSACRETERGKRRTLSVRKTQSTAGEPIPLVVVPKPVVDQTTSRPDIADQLQKLAALHQSGALSRAEFEVAKASLLGQGEGAQQVWWCNNCGYEVGVGGRCASCGGNLLPSQAPALDPHASGEEVGYRLDNWEGGGRARLIGALMAQGIPHRFEDEELVVLAVDEPRVDAAVAEALNPPASPQRRQKMPGITHDPLSPGDLPTPPPSWPAANQPNTTTLLGDPSSGPGPFPPTLTRPTWAPPSGNHSAPAPVDNSRAWLLVAAPLLLLCISAAFLYSGVSEGLIVGFVLAVVTNTVLILWDSRYLKDRGCEVSTLLGIFFVPAYLAQRSSRLRQGQGPLAGWIAAFVVAIAGSALLGNHFVQLNMPYVQSSVSQWIDKQTGTQVSVTCPTRSVWAVGSTFICSASDSGGSVSIQVTVTNSNGDITWRAIG